MGSKDKEEKTDIAEQAPDNLTVIRSDIICLRSIKMMFMSLARE